jgi:hypothetical protein
MNRGHRAHVLVVHTNGETSSVVGPFDDEVSALLRARSEIEHGRGGVTETFVFNAAPVAHFRAIEVETPTTVSQYRRSAIRAEEIR